MLITHTDGAIHFSSLDSKDTGRVISPRLPSRARAKGRNEASAARL